MAGPMVGMTWHGDLVERSARPGENALRYMHLLADAGLTPVLLTAGTGAAAIGRLDGLLLPGGLDLAPSRYGQEPGDHLGEVDPELDRLELETFAAARARGLPVLGICRGQQVLNVALGGTLVQHVVHPQWDGDPSTPVHDVTMVPGTHLHRVLGADTVSVNSGHHQAVDAIAAPLRAAAHTSDGCVEALEAGELLLMAVQWHPEEMPESPASRRLLAGFAEWLDVTGR